MALFRVQSPDGRTVTLQGDSAPSDADLDGIFSSLPAKPQPTPADIQKIHSDAMNDEDSFDPASLAYRGIKEFGNVGESMLGHVTKNLVDFGGELGAAFQTSPAAVKKVFTRPRQSVSDFLQEDSLNPKSFTEQVEPLAQPFKLTGSYPGDVLANLPRQMLIESGAMGRPETYVAGKAISNVLGKGASALQGFIDKKAGAELEAQIAIKLKARADIEAQTRAAAELEAQNAQSQAASEQAQQQGAILSPWIQNPRQQSNLRLLESGRTNPLANEIQQGLDYYQAQQKIGIDSQMQSAKAAAEQEMQQIISDELNKRLNDIIPQQKPFQPGNEMLPSQMEVGADRAGIPRSNLEMSAKLAPSNPILEAGPKYDRYNIPAPAERPVSNTIYEKKPSDIVKESLQQPEVAPVQYADEISHDGMDFPTETDALGGKQAMVRGTEGRAMPDMPLKSKVEQADISLDFNKPKSKQKDMFGGEEGSVDFSREDLSKLSLEELQSRLAKLREKSGPSKQLSANVPKIAPRPIDEIPQKPITELTPEVKAALGKEAMAAYEFPATSKYTPNSFIDTASRFARDFGAGGGRIVDQFAKGAVKEDRLLSFSEHMISEAQKGFGGKIPQESNLRIISALQDRVNADKILKTDAERNAYKSFQELYRPYRAELDNMGIKTEDNYFTHIPKAIEKAESDVRQFMPDAGLIPSAETGFIKQRIAEIPYKTDPVETAKIYVKSMSRFLSYKEPLNYYRSEGQFQGKGFNEDIPDLLKQAQNFGSNARAARDYVGDILLPRAQSNHPFVRWAERRISQTYKSDLYGNLKAAAMNRTQELLANARITNEARKIGNELYSAWKSGRDFPNIKKAMSAIKDRETVIVSEFDKSLGVKTGALDFMGKAERINWDASGAKGIVQGTINSPEFKGQKHTLVEIEKALGDPAIMGRATKYGINLMEEIQLSTSRALKPEFFRNASLLKRIVGQYKRFQVGFLEVTARNMKVSGVTGGRANSILRRAIPDEVAVVENLRKVETMIAAVKQSMPEYKSKGWAEDANSFLKFLAEQESQINNAIKQIEPRTTSKSLAWTGAASAAGIGISLAWNLLWVNVRQNVNPQKPKKFQEQLDWAVSSAFNYGSPVNLAPGSYLKPRSLAPSIPFAEKDGSVGKSIVKQAVRMTPGLGVIDRLSGRSISSGINSVLFPKKRK